MGRPVTGESAKTTRMELRLEPGEAEAYANAARSAGVTKSDWIRSVLNIAVRAQKKRVKVDPGSVEKVE